MTYAISVPTPFTDISELAESFYSRVDEERLMLPNGDAIPEGEWVEFHVTLADGSAALAGQGRCTGSFDNGEDRAPEHRFDVVMDSLQLDEMAQIYFERILQVRAAYEGDEPQTGETQVPEEYAQAEAAEAYAEPGPEDYAEPAAEDPAAQYAEPPAAEPAAEEYAQAEAYAEPGAEAYAEAVAEEYAEAPAAEEYAEPAMEDHASIADDEGVPMETVVADVSADEEVAPVEAIGLDEPPGYEEAPGTDDFEALDDAVDEVMTADAADASWEEESGATEIGSLEEYGAVEQPSQPPAAPAAPALSTPDESKIYELPPPAAPEALPSPHAVAEVLTRPVLHASWSPEPAPRPEPSPSSGLFQYAVGAGLPRPGEPPRPQIDPSLRVAPAPQPGDPHQAPERAASAEAYDEAAPAADAYAEAEEHAAYDYDESYADADDAEAAPEDAGAYAEAYGEDDYAEAPAQAHDEDAYGDEASELEAAPEYAEEAPEAEVYADAPAEDAYDDVAQYDESATLDAEAYEVPPGGDAETRQVDIGGLPDDIEISDETMQVEIPEES